MNLAGRTASEWLEEEMYVISVCCMKNYVWNMVSDADGMKDICGNYMEKLRMSGVVEWVVLRLCGPIVSFTKKRIQ